MFRFCSMLIFLTVTTPLLRSQDTLGMAALLAKLTEAATDPKDCLAMLRKIQQRCQHNDDLYHYIQAAKKAGVALDMAGYFDQAVEAYKLGTEPRLFRLPKRKEEWDALGWLYVNIGYTHAWYGHYYEAKTWYEAARFIFETHSVVDATVVAYLHRELGNLYTRFGEYPAAQLMLDRVRQVAMAAGDHDLAAQAMNDLAIAQADLGNNHSAVQTCQQALALTRLSPVSVCLLESTLSLCYDKTGQKTDARQHAQKGLQACQQVEAGGMHPSGKYWLSNLYKQLGTLSDDSLQAIAHFNTALNLLKAHFPDTLRREVAKVHLLIGDFYLRQNDPKRALQHQQRALKAVLYEFSEDDPQINPPPKDFYPENSIVEALHGKARSWALYYQKTKHPDYLELALECYRLLFEAAKVYRRGHQFESSSLAVVAEVNHRTSEVLDLLWQYDQITPDKDAVEKVFHFMEQSRSVLLFEALRHSDASAIANVSDSLLQQELQLNSQIAQLDKALFFAKQNQEKASVEQLQAKAFQLRQQLAALHSRIEKNYPAFYQLKYADADLPLKEAQMLLNERQAMLNYFPTDQYLYLLVVRHDWATFHRVKLEQNLNQQVAAFRQVIAQFQLPGSDKEALCTTYTDQAQRLYTLLLGPVANRLPTHLIIVPGGMLGLLPFGALLTERPAETCRFRDYPFLIRRHSLSYSYSAALLREVTLPLSTFDNEGLALAPTFDGSGGFGALKYNQESARKVAALMGGKALLAAAANRQQFEQMATKADWLYLATHAQANNYAGEFSFFALSGKGGGYDSVFARELYAMRLPVELVYLGACETAAGNWQEGEGINSLARAFFYAGAKSLVTTLWSINDESNNHLTEYFFERLKDGMPRNEALRSAQLQHIQTVPHDLYAHPVYWAAYVAMGKMEPMTRNCYLCVALLGLVVGGCVWFWWYSHHKSSVKNCKARTQ